MAVLMDLSNLQKVLEDFAKDIRENYKEHLQYHDRLTQKKPSNVKQKLIDSIETHVVQGDREFLVTMDLNAYWKYVEEGVQGKENPRSPYKNPGWKAYPHIYEWVEIKPIIPRPGKNGKLPSTKSLAYLITRGIVQNGTQGTHDLAVTKENVLNWYRDRISEALGRDMERYIAKVFAE